MSPLSARQESQSVERSSTEILSTAPLTGFVIGVTADRRASEQIELLTRRGATCQHAPVLTTQPLGPAAEVESVTRALLDHPPDLVVITTDVGLRSWVDAAYAVGLGDDLLDTLGAVRLIVRGNKARGGALALGLTVEWASPGATSGEVVSHLATLAAHELRIAVQLDGSLDLDLCDRLEALGPHVTPVPTYMWGPPDDLGAAEQLVRSIVGGQLDAVTFTARPSVERLVDIAVSIDLGPELVDAFQEVVAGCVGPVCAESARRAGFARVLAPTRFRLGSMVHMLSAHFADQVIELELGGVPIALHGRRALLGADESVQLSDREFQVLECLVRRAGAPCSKETLLAEVWNDSCGDTHAVEVTVGRLRRRLGRAGAGIETVYRRGYRLV